MYSILKKNWIQETFLPCPPVELKHIASLTIFLLVSLFSVNFLYAGSKIHKNNYSPRIILTEERITAIKELQESDTLLAQLVEVVKFYADKALTQDVIKYEFDGPGNPRLKEQRRAAMFRVFNLALTWHLTDDPKYAEKARDHLLAAADFPDWASWHFLNVGEISLLMGLGYDWLYTMLTPDEREKISNAIIQHGLREGVKAYNGTHSEKWWKTSMSNWNQVCNGGLTIAALAVANEWPDSSIYIINQAVHSIPIAMEGYKPDGAWYEGPTYWAYGTTYNALMLDALQTTHGHLHGLETNDGYISMGKSGLYHIQTAGPTGLYFNYGDAKTTLYFSPVLFWLSEQFNHPTFAWFERLLCKKDYPRMLSGDLMNDDTLDRFLAFLVIWYSNKGENTTYDDLAFDTRFTSKGVSLAALRNGWGENDVYLAVKAGDTQVPHGHMDLGSFVLDAKGERWALELGGDNYALPGYFDFSGPRWNYFRLNNFGHSTLVMDNAIQNMHGKSTITRFNSTADYGEVMVNLNSAYKDQSYGTTRQFEFIDRKKIVITDEFSPAKDNMDVRWGMITPASIELFGKEALLTLNGKQIKLSIIEPENFFFETLSTKPKNSAENQNTGTRMLAATGKAGNQGFLSRIKIEINPFDTVISFTSNKFIGDPPHTISCQIYPNPVSDQAIINLHLLKDQKINLTVLDLNGRIVEVIYQGILQSGLNQIAWDTSEINGKKLQNGFYFLRIHSENEIITKKIVIKSH
jgi:hypothetical protein